MQNIVPAKYLDKAMTALSGLGIQFKNEPAPVISVLEKVERYDGNRI